MERQEKRNVIALTVTQIMADWTLLATGESGNIHLEEAWLREAYRLYRLFCRKNKDYGEKNLGVGGIIGIVVRLSDKLGRQWNVVMNGKPSVTDEKLLDTFRDAANYNIIGGLMSLGEWPSFSFEDAQMSQNSAAVIESVLRDALPDIDEDTLEKIREALA